MGIIAALLFVTLIIMVIILGCKLGDDDERIMVLIILGIIAFILTLTLCGII